MDMIMMTIVHYSIFGFRSGMSHYWSDRFRDRWVAFNSTIAYFVKSWISISNTDAIYFIKNGFQEYCTAEALFVLSVDNRNFVHGNEKIV